MTADQSKQVIELLAGIDIELDDAYISLEDIETFDDLSDYLQEDGYLDVEIIYHYNAMKYLLEHDPSLQYSLGIASDLGYEAKDLNSELLASLLASENTRESFYELREEIETILEGQA